MPQSNIRALYPDKAALLSDLRKTHYIKDFQQVKAPGFDELVREYFSSPEDLWDALLELSSNVTDTLFSFFNEADWNNIFPDMGVLFEFLKKVEKHNETHRYPDRIYPPQIIYQQIALFIKTPADLNSLLYLEKKHELPNGLLKQISRQHWQNIFQSPEDFAEFLGRHPEWITRVNKRPNSFHVNLKISDFINNADEFNRLLSIFQNQPQLTRHLLLGCIEFEEACRLISTPSVDDFIHRFSGDADFLLTLLILNFFNATSGDLSDAAYSPGLISKMQQYGLGNEQLLNRLNNKSFQQIIISLMDFSNLDDQKAIDWLSQLDDKHLQRVLSSKQEQLKPEVLNTLEGRFDDQARKSMVILHNDSNDNPTVERLGQLTVKDFSKYLDKHDAYFQSNPRVLSAFAESQQDNAGIMNVIIDKHLAKLDEQFWQNEVGKLAVLSHILHLQDGGKQHLLKLDSTRKHEAQSLFQDLSSDLNPLMDKRATAGKVIEVLVSPFLFLDWLFTPRMAYYREEELLPQTNELCRNLIISFPLWFPIAILASGAGIIGAAFAFIVRQYQKGVENEIEQLMDGFSGDGLKLAEKIVEHYPSSTAAENSPLLGRGGFFGSGSDGVQVKQVLPPTRLLVSSDDEENDDYDSDYLYGSS